MEDVRVFFTWYMVVGILWYLTGTFVLPWMKKNDSRKKKRLQPTHFIEVYHKRYSKPGYTTQTAPIKIERLKSLLRAGSLPGEKTIALFKIKKK